MGPGTTLPRAHCDILVKNVATFCPCWKNLPEIKVKIFTLIALAKEISKQLSIDCAVCLFLFTVKKNILMKGNRSSKYKN